MHKIVIESGKDSLIDMWFTLSYQQLVHMFLIVVHNAIDILWFSSSYKIIIH
jgi:hypothetical protein